MAKVLLGLLLLVTSALNAQPIRIAKVSNSPDQMVGAAVLEVVYAKAGISMEIVPISGKRSLVESSQGRLDGEVHRILEIGELYPSLIRVPTATNYIEQTIFSKNKEFVVHGCESLRGKLVGVALGVRYAEMCTEGMETVAVFPDSSSLMKSLNRDIVDYAITSKLNGLVQLKSFPDTKVIPLKPAIGKRLLFHYVHKSHQDLVPQLNKILVEMQQSGELELLRQQTIHLILETPFK